MIISDLLSPDYLALIRQYHSQTSWGASGASHSAVIFDFAKELKARTILDYGCGRGTLKKTPSMQNFDVREYDPGIPEKSAMPEPADLVVATDVMEHVERECLTNVWRHLKELAIKGIFLNIALNKAKAILPDGRNAHLIIQQPDFWLYQLKIHGLEPVRWNRRKGMYVWIKRYW